MNGKYRRSFLTHSVIRIGRSQSHKVAAKRWPKKNEPLLQK